MRSGFKYNHGLCVSCKACSAACMLENQWDFKARTLYIHNNDTVSYEPVINLSMACNHCEDPLCLKGCPSGAYNMDSLSGAVIIDPEKCIGCRYCIWNCPYDAPKFNNERGIIEKCNFCNHRLQEGTEPACSSSCPTGALSFGEISETTSNEGYSWFAEKKINPALQLTGVKADKPLLVVPAMTSAEPLTGNIPERKNIAGELSLIAFSFLTTLAVAIRLAGFDKAFEGARYIPFSLVLIAGLFSLLHLKTRFKAWRSLINTGTSPLSREILMFLAYGILLAVSLLVQSSLLEGITIASGILLLIAIDSVYTWKSFNPLVIFHSGQSFLTGLIIASFLMNSRVPFIFIACIKLIFCTVMLMKERRDNLIFVFRFFRLALLIIAGIVTAAKREITVTVYIVFLAGELSDRILYYVDFEPVNVKQTINKPLISDIK
jgi:Fe-S-cluster-containing dehydrogenase component/DMSO reductase anchor subunit